MKIEELRALCQDDTMMITQHLLLRMQERGILYADVTATIMAGEIIEQYPDDYPYPSCLVLGIPGKPLHLVCGIGSGRLWVITAYYPDPTKWETDLKTRKEPQA